LKRATFLGGAKFVWVGGKSSFYCGQYVRRERERERERKREIERDGIERERDADNNWEQGGIKKAPAEYFIGLWLPGVQHF
jgi:hypothetical protein